MIQHSVAHYGRSLTRSVQFPPEKISFKYFCKPSASNELDTASLIARWGYLILGRAVQREVDITTNYKWTQGGRRWQQEKKATFSSNVSMLNICWNTEDMLSSFAVNCIQTVSPLESVCILQYKLEAKLWNLKCWDLRTCSFGQRRAGDADWASLLHQSRCLPLHMTDLDSPPSEREGQDDL